MNYQRVTFSKGVQDIGEVLFLLIAMSFEVDEKFWLLSKCLVFNMMI